MNNMTPLEAYLDYFDYEDNDGPKRRYLKVVDAEMFEFLKEFIDRNIVFIYDEEWYGIIDTLEKLNNSSKCQYLIECEWWEPIMDKASNYYRKKTIDEFLENNKE